MSRSGYSEDCDDQWAMIRWRGAVNSAIKGKNGQAFFIELRDSLDALPEKKLVSNVLEDDSNQVCALGALGKARGLDMSTVDPDDYESVANLFNINEKLVQETVWINDEYWYYETDKNGKCIKDENGEYKKLTPESRFEKVYTWVESNIK